MTTEKLYLVATETGKIEGEQFKAQETAAAGKVWGIDNDGSTTLLDGAGNFVPLDKMVIASESRAGLYTLVGADSTTKVFANARFSVGESPTSSNVDLFTVYVNRIDSSVGSMVAMKSDANKMYCASMSGGVWSGWTDITAGSTGGIILHPEIHNMIGRLGVVELMTNKSNGSVEVFGAIYFTASESPDKTGSSTYAVYVHYLSAQHWSMIAVDRYLNEIYMTSYYNGTLAPWTKLTKENVPIIDNNTWMVSKYSREQLYQKCVTDGNVRIVLHNNFEDTSERPTAGCQYYLVIAYRVERACTIIAYDVFDCRMFISDRDSNIGVEGVWHDWKEFAQVGYSYTKAESDAKYPVKDDVYTKTESDAKYPLIGNVYTKTESDALYPLKTNVYTKTESEARYQYKISSAALAITGYHTSTTEAPYTFSADTSSRYVNRCYKITDNLFYLCIFVKCSVDMTTSLTYTAINAGGIKVGGKVPQVCALTAVDRSSQRAVGCWINYQGLVYLHPTATVEAGDGICICGIVHTP